MEGFYIVSRLENVESIDLLFNGNKFENLYYNIILESGLTPLKYSCHNFTNKSYSACYILAESHVCMHTWPELNGLNLSIFTCNYENNNTEKCKNLYQLFVNLFKPKKENMQSILI